MFFADVYVHLRVACLCCTFRYLVVNEICDKPRHRQHTHNTNKPKRSSETKRNEKEEANKKKEERRKKRKKNKTRKTLNGDVSH